MDKVRLDGRVAVVTGAGRGLGRAYALALAARGARVVVNDLGAELSGEGGSSAVAQSVVDEIRQAGGEAVSNGADISVEEGGAALVAQATEAFGRLDIVVNNAGICRDRPFAECDMADFERSWRINVMGHVAVTRAAWPMLVGQRYGRVILTASGAGLFGLKDETAYATSKGAIHGLMRALAIEGREHGVLVNAVFPGGVTRMHEEAFPDPAVLDMMRGLMPAELVAPALVWLSSEACAVTGQGFSVWGGRVSRIVVGSGLGLIDRALTPEAILAGEERVLSAEGLYEPGDGIDDVRHWQAKILER